MKHPHGSIYGKENKDGSIRLYQLSKKRNSIGKLVEKNNKLYYIKNVKNRKVHYYRKLDAYCISEDLCAILQEFEDVTIYYIHTPQMALKTTLNTFQQYGIHLPYLEGFLALKVAKWELVDANELPV